MGLLPGAAPWGSGSKPRPAPPPPPLPWEVRPSPGQPLDKALAQPSGGHDRPGLSQGSPENQPQMQGYVFTVPSWATQLDLKLPPP